jgi:hypothetical protein
MGQLEQFTKSIIERVFTESYPYLKLPAIIYATVIRATELSETYEVKKLEITDEDNNRTFKAHVTAHWYEYTLKVLDRFGNADDTFPELPGVRSKIPLEAGIIVAIGLAFGSIEPTIIGEVIL